MRWNRIIPCAALAALLSACAETAVEPLAESEGPLFSKGEGMVIASASGHANLTSLGGLRTQSFTARMYADGTVKGEVQVYNRGSRDWIHGDITCLTVVGNAAWMGVRIERSSIGASVGVFRVVDNGEGEDAVPDQMSLMQNGSPSDYCSSTPDVPPLRDIEGGNIEVR